MKNNVSIGRLLWITVIAILFTIVAICVPRIRSFLEDYVQKTSFAEFHRHILWECISTNDNNVMIFKLPNNRQQIVDEFFNNHSNRIRRSIERQGKNLIPTDKLKDSVVFSKDIPYVFILDSNGKKTWGEPRRIYSIDPRLLNNGKMLAAYTDGGVYEIDPDMVLE